jgi:hypothetical protein
MRVRRQSKHELAVAVRPRYLKAGRREKGRLLDEFVASTGYHRRYALMLLRHGPPGTEPGVAASRPRPGRPRTYSPVAIGALRTEAETLGWPCGKRLAPFLEEVVPALERAGRLRLTPAVRAQLLGLSAATIDRRLRPFRLARGPGTWHGLGGTKPGTLLKQQVPIKTYTRWNDRRVGFVEVDLVAHGGASAAGRFLHTLVATDLATGWTECLAVPAKGPLLVCAGLDALQRRLPFPLLGVDSDNGSEFLNEHLLRYCREHRITFTRSRPYWKNDQAHVEQKNWSVVRKLVGYGRFEGAAALAQLNRLYEVLRLWTNHWQPVRQLVSKERDAQTGKTRKRYDRAQTPYRRLLAAGYVPPGRHHRLAAEHHVWGPVQLRQQLADLLERLYALEVRPPPFGTPSHPAETRKRRLLNDETSAMLTPTAEAPIPGAPPETQLHF